MNSWWTLPRQRAAEERSRKGGLARAAQRRKARELLEERAALEVEEVVAPCTCEMPQPSVMHFPDIPRFARCTLCGLIIPK